MFTLFWVLPQLETGRLSAVRIVEGHNVTDDVILALVVINVFGGQDIGDRILLA